MTTYRITRFVATLLLAAGLLASFFGSATPALAAPGADASNGLPTATVSTGRLNVRTGPSVAFTVVTRIDRGQVMDLLGRNQSATWVRIRLPNAIEGWVSALYIQASVPIADLPVNGSSSAEPTAIVSVPQLELRAGPANTSAVLALLAQGQTISLLGRTADSAWVKVRAAGIGEGWVLGQVSVRLPGSESGVLTQPFATVTTVASLPIVPSSQGPRVSVSLSQVKPGAPIYVTLEGFPANRDVVATLTSPLNPNGFAVATGRTDGNGYAQLYFRMPSMWPSGASITESNLSLAVGTTDGAITIWNGLVLSMY